ARACFRALTLERGRNRPAGVQPGCEHGFGQLSDLGDFLAHPADLMLGANRDHPKQPIGHLQGRDGLWISDGRHDRRSQLGAHRVDQLTTGRTSDHSGSSPAWTYWEVTTPC